MCLCGLNFSQKSQQNHIPQNTQSRHKKTQNGHFLHSQSQQTLPLIITKPYQKRPKPLFINLFNVNTPRFSLQHPKISKQLKPSLLNLMNFGLFNSKKLIFFMKKIVYIFGAK